ncbi:fruit bromelain-like [Trifolium medium]|uniref:Fruit bromelain-like n=1 Tax=Trifolium medium TaxID=97028 RepID=A0A392N3F5_9FABA|nr:fruit bromelain-like [Trifolium medium]
MHAVSRQPVSVCICAGFELDRDCGNGEMYKKENCHEIVFMSPCNRKLGWMVKRELMRANHSVLLVGYETTKEGKPYWLPQNSWGTLGAEAGSFNFEQPA